MNRALLRIILVIALVFVALHVAGRIGIDRRDEHGMTALMRAARAGERAEVERLVREGANVKARVPTRHLREIIAFLSFMQSLPKSDIGYTPLFYAVDGGDSAVVRILLEKGARAVDSSGYGMSPLDLAILTSNVPVLELLTAAGARSDPRQLSKAVMQSSPATVRFLLAHGADPNEIAPRNPRRAYDAPKPPIVVAAMRGDAEVIQALVDAGANVSAADENGWTALRWAAQARSGRNAERSDSTVALLQSAGAVDPSGARAAALFEAIYKRDVAAVRAALASRANPNARDDRGVPALVPAASLGLADIVEALIGAGADVNANPEHDTTPLVAAASRGSVAAVRALLDAGARIDQPDRLRRTALVEASSRGHAEVGALLLSRSASISPDALPAAALSGDVEQVRMLLDARADPNAANGHALQEATRGCARRDNSAVIRLLLERGADARLAGSDGYTPLHRAAGLCDATVVSFLLQRGADPNAVDGNGYSPLISAASSGMLDNVRALIARGADVNARDRDGKSVLAYAANYPEVVAELRRAGAR